MAHTKNYPFYDWVPKPLGIIILIMLFCPIMFINGAYTINSRPVLELSRSTFNMQAMPEQSAW